MTDEYQGPEAGPGPGEPGDAEAMSAVRAGDTGAFDVLYRRHLNAARRMARVLARDPSDVDDLVAEAFARLLGALTAGRGPETAFRPYLFATMRHLFYERTRQEKRLQITDDMTRHETGVPFVDTALEALETSLVSKAFASLPERWQTVLWHTEVERERPSKVAPLLGLTPNGVAALAYRAREGLRQQYLQEHIAADPDDSCRWAIERLGAYVRGGLARRDTAKVDQHLQVCRRCHVLFVELGEVSARMRDLLAPALVASGYFAATGKFVWLAPVVEPVVKVAKRRDTQVVGGVVVAAALATLALLVTSQPGPQNPPPGAIPPPLPVAPPSPSQAVLSPPPPQPPSPSSMGSPTPVATAVLAATLDEVGALVRGRPGTLVMTVAHQGMTVAFGPRGLVLDTGPLTARLTLPPGVTVRTGSPGDGWQCSGSTCIRESMSAGQSTRAYVPVDVSGSAADGNMVVRLTAPRAGAVSSVARLARVQSAGLAASFAATLQATVITGGNRLMACSELPLLGWLLGCLGVGVDNGDYYMIGYCDPRAPAGAQHVAAISGAEIPVRGDVVWAGLYWSGSGAPPPSPSAHLRVPGEDGYRPVHAGRVDRQGGSYQAFANVTDVVRGTRGGTWWVAVEQAFDSGVGSYGGWALVVVVADGGPARHVAVLDGYQAVKSGPAATPVYGTPGARAKVAFVGWEGDRGVAGDRLRLGDQALGGDNVASSTADGTPAGWNTFGVDAHVFDTRMPAGQDQPSVTATGAGDAWYLGVLALASEASPG